MRRLAVCLAVLVVGLVPAGGWGQYRGPGEWTAHPPIHPKGPAQSSLPAGGYTPGNIRSIYGFNNVTIGNGAGQVIAIVDAFDDPNIAKDLQTFVGQFHLASITTSGCTVGGNVHPCFQKVYAQNKPKTNGGWALEISLDVEWAHAIAPQADILLVEAQTNSFFNLMGAVQKAAGTAGVSVVSMSWGGGEFSSETSYDAAYFAPPSSAGVMFTASAGDSGSGAEWPAASPYVLSVGGTSLNPGIAPGNTYVNETAWSGSGGGVSAYETEPRYQSAYPIPSTGGQRGIPDVAYVADPNTGVYVYDSVSYFGQSGWFIVGGTSVGAPQWAALIAIVNGERTTGNLSTNPGSGVSGSPMYSAGYPALSGTYYANFHDIASGNNGGFSAGAGYDFVTGLGSPQVGSLVPYLASH